MALAKHGTPEIFNADQGSQFTSGDWIDLLTDAKVKINMDGKGRWIDNLRIKRLSRSLKYECVYLHAFEKGSEAKVCIRAWLSYSKARRPHSTHGILTHDRANASKTKLTRLAALMKPFSSLKKLRDGRKTRTTSVCLFSKE